MTTEELTIEVNKALEEIRPFLNSDGGDISLISTKTPTTLCHVAMNRLNTQMNEAQ
jgi:Fe-S cluster biogenesis protein NfuA